VLVRQLEQGVLANDGEREYCVGRGEAPGSIGMKAVLPGVTRGRGWLSGPLWLMLVCLTGTSLAGFLGRSWWWFDLASHFRVQYAVASLLIGVAAIVWRRWLAALTAAVLLIVNLWLVLPFYARKPGGPDGGESLRVLCMNVNAANERHEQVWDVVKASRADIVFVLEYTARWEAALRAMEVDYPYMRTAPQADSFGIAVYSRVPLTRVEVSDLVVAGIPSIAVGSRLGGQHVTLFCVHVLPPVSRASAASRDAQLREIARRAGSAEQPHAVVGDLNCTSWSPVFRDLLRDGGLVDSRIGFGAQPTWPRCWLLRIPIDHCLVSREVVVRHRSVVAVPGSDHLGVIVDLGVRGRRG